MDSEINYNHNPIFIKKWGFWFLIVLLYTIISRILFLGFYPPGNILAFWFRLPSALSGIINVILLILIIKTYNKNLSILSGLMLTIMPWQIEQSRIYSQVSMGLSVILLATYLTLLRIKFRWKLVIWLLTVVIFVLLYPNFWLITNHQTLPNITEFFNNIFKLVSVEFLFYKNDSFWLGGFRTYGVMLPSTILIFLFGLYDIILKSGKNSLKWWFIFLCILLFSAASPFFPETREFFLTTPFFAISMGFGIKKIGDIFKKHNNWLKLLIMIYILIIIYDNVLFWHFYINHYSQRIKSEITYEQIKF